MKGQRSPVTNGHRKRRGQRCSADERRLNVDPVGVCLRGEAGGRTEVRGFRAFSQKMQQPADSFQPDSKHLLPRGATQTRYHSQSGTLPPQKYRRFL